MSANVAYPQDSQTLDQLQGLFDAQRRAYAANPMPPAAQRQQWLKALREVLSDERQALIDAISQDFSHRSADETLFAELMPSLHGIHYASKHLSGWMKPSRRAVGIAFQPASAKVIYQPLGVVGVIVPWNYPLYLAIGPLVGALAAGNRVMLKLSESTPATGELLKTLLAKVFPEDLVCVVLGEADVGMAFSRLRFDHLLFTGATSIGKHVMRAAAEHLTPVTLELGGKSPASFRRCAPQGRRRTHRLRQGPERRANLRGAGLRAGAGRSRRGFRRGLQQGASWFYPILANNPDYTAIINERQLARLNAYVKDATDKGATLIPLYDQGQARRMAHSLLLNVSDEMTVMQDEIFGPVLPIVPYRGIDQAFAYINQRPRPLALYYFGYNKREQNRVLHETHSGGVCLNDTLLHVAQDDMPFGGIGPSGMGHYHGHEGFLTFSKAKGVLVKQRLNAAKLIYPPYGKSIQKLIQKLFIR